METFIGLIAIILVLVIARLLYKQKHYVYRCLDCDKVLMTSDLENERGVIECECGWRDYRVFCDIKKETTHE
jgi:DNA-directed RNA polymerase subunit RPC12/RpoP